MAMKLTCPVCEMTFERFGEMGAFIDHTNSHIFFLTDLACVCDTVSHSQEELWNHQSVRNVERSSFTLD